MSTDVVKEILTKKEDFIRRHLVLSSTVVEKLRQNDVIGQYTYGQMMTNRSNTEKQMTLLIVCLKARGMTSFQSFLDVLRQTFHGWIADDILDSNIETSKSSILPGNSVSVREVISKSTQDTLSTRTTNERNLNPSGHNLPYGSSGSNGLYQYYDPRFAFPTNVDMVYGSGIGRNIRSMYQRRRKEYTSSDHLEREPRDRYGRVSPITQVPENLRDLQRTFDNENASTRKSIAILRQEEVTIKALLQQNMREQQDMLVKQTALVEIKDKIKEINNQASQLFKPEPDVQLTRKRLSHLQRVPWNIRD